MSSTEVLSALMNGAVGERNLLRGNGRRLHWIESHHGGPTVVLVSGAGETFITWAPVLRGLAESSRIVAYDRPGLGASDPTRRLTVDSQVDDLVALLGEVGPAIVVGHSWGGLLAQLAEWKHPQLILGLILVDPSHEAVLSAPSALDRLLSGLALRGIVALQAIGLFKAIARGIGEKLARKSTSEPDIQRALTEAYLSGYAGLRQVAMIGAENRLADRSGPLIASQRQSPTVPVTVLCATARKAELMEGSGTIQLIADSGHYIHHDRPDVVISAVRTIVELIQRGDQKSSMDPTGS